MGVDNLKCSLTPVSTINAILSPIGRLDVEFIDFPEDDLYEGEYRIYPDTNVSISLDTSHKVLKQDVIVMKIPYYQTANLSGGDTVYIGGN